MRAYVIYLVVLSMAATLVSSRPSASYLTQSFRALSGPLYKRQGPTPSQCTPSCDPVQGEINDGCPITACCTQAFETSYYNCLLCLGTADNTTDYTTSQADINDLYATCYERGYSLPELTFPGQNPSSILSTSSYTITSTVTGTSPASVSSPPTTVSVPTSVTSASTSISQTTILSSSASSTSSGTSTSTNGAATSTTSTSQTTILPSSASSSSGTSTSTNGTATSPTSISQTTTLPSSAPSAPSGTLTFIDSTTPSPTFVPTTSSAALELNVGGSGVWALVAAAMGLILLRNN
ncbi:hypothetical protein BD769DRAFT_1002 [Suillus cothurnatus]|nr:hypothetical protein BD769DRAFT_1002 [Suillus cothurnatus]